MKKLKKLLMCLLAAALLLLTTVPASAVEQTEPPSGDTFAGAYEEPVVDVLVPVDIDFVIDPFEMAERGQVYSDPATFVNHGETGVKLTITNVTLKFANHTDFEAVAPPITEELWTAKKKISMRLVIEAPFDNREVLLTGAPYVPIELELGASGGEGQNVCTLSLSGAVNLYPKEEWESGDVKINVTYRMDPILPPIETPEEDIKPAEEEEPPAELSKPNEMTSLEEPSKPTEVSKPVEPALPSEPPQGGTNGEAAQNSEPSTETKPAETNPTEPDKAADTKPTEADKPAEAKPTEADKVTAPKPTESAVSKTNAVSGTEAAINVKTDGNHE